MLDRLRRHYGNMFTFLGVSHTIVAIGQFWDEWADLFGAGFFNQIDEQGAPYQGLGYWFLILGPILIATRLLAQSHLNATGALPRAFSWIVIVTSFAAALAMYLNGMWLVGLVGILGLAFAAQATSRRRDSGDCREASAPAPRLEF